MSIKGKIKEVINDLNEYAYDHDESIDGYFNDKEYTEAECDKMLIDKLNEILKESED